MKKGDVLFGKRRAYQKKVAVAPFDGIFSAHGMVLRPKEDVIDKDFFPLFIASDYFLDKAIEISVGSLSPTINWRDLKVLEFELPTIEEQKELSNLLWGINNTIDAYRELLATSDELVKSRFVELFKDCKREPLGNYVEQIRGVSYKPIDLVPELDLQHVTLLRANNISNDMKTNLDDVQFVNKNKVSEVQIIRENDILMCASSGSLEHVGKVALCNLRGEYTFGAFCKIIRPNGRLKSEYIATFMNGDEYREIIKSVAVGSNIKNLRNEHISSLMVPIPSDDLQKKFIAEIKQLDKLKFDIEKTIKKLTLMYKKILKERLG